MNDFELDANEIMAWLRGDTDHLDLHLTPKKEKKPEGDRKVNYSIQLEKRPIEPPKKQSCENCYERLPTVTLGGEKGVEVPSLPQHLKNRVVCGSLEGEFSQSFSGKTILYCCNSYYVHYNFSLQCALHLAASLSIPLIVVMIRDADEYQYPFSMHSFHLLHHLCEFHSSLVDLNITPLLLFTSSFTSLMTKLIAELHPLFVVTEPNPDIRYQLELNRLCKDPSNHKILVVSNAIESSIPIRCSSLSADSYFISRISSNLQTLPIPPSHMDIQLDKKIQSSVVYSPSKEETMISCLGDTDSPSFVDAALILPPFLTNPPPRDSSQGLAYGRDTQDVFIVAHWVDIQHEMRFYQSKPYFQMSLKDRLRCSEWYYPYYRGSAQNTNSYRVCGAIRSGFISVYELMEWYPEGRKELFDFCALELYYHSYFSDHLGTVYFRLTCRGKHAEYHHNSDVCERNQCVRATCEFPSLNPRRQFCESFENHHRSGGSKNNNTECNNFQQLNSFLLLYYIQYLLCSVYKFTLSQDSNQFSLFPILFSLQPSWIPGRNRTLRL